MDEVDKMDDIFVHQINTGDGDGADIIFSFNDQRIAVSIFPSSAAQHNLHSDRKQRFLEDRLIYMLGQTVSADVSSDEREEIVDEVLGLILDAGKAIFTEVDLLNKPIPQSFSQDLHTLLYPKILTFCLKTISDKATIIPIKSDETYTYLEVNFDSNIESYFDIDDSLPQYSSKQISILETLVEGAGHVVSRVLVNNKEMLCKAWGKGLLDSDLEQELASLQKMRRAFLHTHTSIRVPQILGYVKHPEAECTIGFLREWVPGDSLRNIDIPTTLERRRRKWASQICETVNQLHEVGVIWGDGKASNVIIDEEDSAWLIDFGGGFTEGWVSKELADTAEGDEQAVKIMEFLNVEKGN
ncbi:hypothetical protein F4805DRAFT_352899 [Annulohypoxylon moriforme]|nr:hypothetical protein F4805DRAFT_352899 [Annulohypoxylon moriforme]